MNNTSIANLQSMENKVAMIFSNLHAYNTAKDILARHQINLICELTSFHNIGNVAATLVSNGAKVIICRGDAARRQVQNRISVPTISVKYSFSDFASAIDLARQYGSRIIFLAFTQDLFDTAKRENFFWNVQTTLVHVRNYDDARREIRKLLPSGIDVIVGGQTAISIGEEFHIPSVLVQANENAIYEALEEAFQSLQIAEERELRYNTMSLIIESASHGMLTVDSDGVISHLNLGACRLLNLSKDIIGQQYRQYFPFSDIIAQTLEGKTFHNYLFDYNDSYLILSSSPVLLGGNPHGMVMNIQGGNDVQSLENKIRRRVAHNTHIAKHTLSDILGTSIPILQAKRLAALYAQADSTVLITGESGTGKELFAQSIHNAGPRRNYPFVAVNCAAIPDSLLESILFGYEKGAFTGASTEGKEGIFEQAHNGTIFLDEIGEIPHSIQIRLLRVIQEREVTRVGGKTVIPVNIRIIVATNRDLFSEMKHGNFRLDLYYRLNVLSLHIPALNERPEDIPVLAENFARTLCRKHLRKEFHFDDSALDVLIRHTYHGNIRELQNIIERVSILCPETIIHAADIYAALHYSPGTHQTGKEAAADLPEIPIQAQKIQAALLAADGNHGNAAAALGISRTTLWRKMKKYGLTSPSITSDL